MKHADPRGIRPTLRRWRRNFSLYNSTGLINPLFDLYTGGSSRPVFYDIDQMAPALRAVGMLNASSITSAAPRVDLAYPNITPAPNIVIRKLRRDGSLFDRSP